MKVFLPEQMRNFDRRAVGQYSVPSIVLMENAALRVVEFLEAKFAPLKEKRVIVLCGKGNNGGDGFAIARHLRNIGCEVSIVLVAAPEDLQGDAKTNYEILQAAQAAFLAAEDVNWPRADIIVDALLGTGFKGDVRDETFAYALKCLCWSRGAIVAVDVPSGLNADSGEADELAVRADFTITFAASKRGFFVRDGLAHCGEIWVGEIGAPRELMRDFSIGAEIIGRISARSLLPHRAIDAHKGTAGKVVVIGGSVGLSGAPALASRAALQVGCGLCVACVPADIQPIVAASILEATSHPLACDEKGMLENAADELPKVWNGAQVVALGPGLSRHENALNFARRVVRECALPLIIDADALYALRAIESDVRARNAPTVLTPHPGEMAELMEIETEEVQNNRYEIAATCAQKFNAIVVLKGARSIVALPDGSLHVNLSGNAGMATGGSGDVLTGTVAGLLAQMRDSRSATLLGVYLHGLAGDLAFAEKSNGLIAGDIAQHLPRALLDLNEARDNEARDEEINARLRRLQ